MEFTTIIFAAAKAAKVSGALLYAICSYESANFTDIHVHNDGGSPSVGICMVKLNTAKMLGYKGTAKTLENDHNVNAEYAAKYLKYQMDRYGDNWCMIAAAYNAGSYNESKVLPGYPRNLKYVRRVQKKLSDENKHRMDCKNERPSN